MRNLSILLMLLALCVVYVPARGDDSVADNLKAAAQPLLKAFSLIGTPYKLGGSRPENGVDCSGFVRFVFEQASDIELPRTALEMSEEGTPVEESQLRPGDLVFFKGRKQVVSHVGIYAGNGEFVHASSRRYKEVTLSHLKDRYWSSHFIGARRILPSP